MENLIIIAIVLGIVFLAGYYIYRAKKNGAKCIGCPYGKSCGTGRCSSECGFSTKNTDN